MSLLERKNLQNYTKMKMEQENMDEKLTIENRIWIEIGDILEQIEIIKASRNPSKVKMRRQEMLELRTIALFHQSKKGNKISSKE